KPKGESGYFLQTFLPGPDGKLKEESRFVSSKAKWGRIGLRRVEKELIFLAANDDKSEAEEIERLPFTDRTIRPVRLDADSGGSPTLVDLWVWDVKVRGGEVTGGIAKRDQASVSPWWSLLAVLPVVGGGVYWLWRRRRLRAREVEESPKPASGTKSAARPPN